jgi:hypothetical protein
MLKETIINFFALLYLHAAVKSCKGKKGKRREMNVGKNPLANVV